MTSIAATMDSLTRDGYWFEFTGPDVAHVRAPGGGKVPDAVMAKLRPAKPEILELLRLRERLLTLAADVGVPDAVVLGLPFTELAVTLEQLPRLWPDADLQRQVLTFYLRSLAGVEPSLPGSLYAQRHPGTEIKP